MNYQEMSSLDWNPAKIDEILRAIYNHVNMLGVDPMYVVLNFDSYKQLLYQILVRDHNPNRSIDSRRVHTPPLGAENLPGLAPWVHTFDSIDTLSRLGCEAKILLVQDSPVLAVGNVEEELYKISRQESPSIGSNKFGRCEWSLPTDRGSEFVGLTKLQIQSNIPMHKLAELKRQAEVHLETTQKLPKYLITIPQILPLMGEVSDVFPGGLLSDRIGPMSIVLAPQLFQDGQRIGMVLGDPATEYKKSRIKKL